MKRNKDTDVGESEQLLLQRLAASQGRWAQITKNLGEDLNWFRFSAISEGERRALGQLIKGGKVADET